VPSLASAAHEDDCVNSLFGPGKPGDFAGSLYCLKNKQTQLKLQSLLREKGGGRKKGPGWNMAVYEKLNTGGKIKRGVALREKQPDERERGESAETQIISTNLQK